MKYTYHGPFTGLTLYQDGQHIERLLHDGAEVDLPPEHPDVRTLVALDRLTPVEGDDAFADAGTDTTNDTTGDTAASPPATPTNPTAKVAPKKGSGA